MRLRDHFWCFTLCFLLLAGCATHRRPGVIVKDDSPASYVSSISYVSTEQEGPPVPSDYTPPANPAVAGFEEEDLPVEAEPDAEVSTKEALAQALAWTIEGLIQYRSGAIEDAHKSLTDAHFRFLEADLPEPLAARGLNLLQAALPADLQLYDPEAIRLHLDRTDRPEGMELVERALVDRGVRLFLSQLDDPLSRERFLDDLIAKTHYYIQYFQGRDRPFFEATYRRKHKYWPRIRNVFAEKELPPELGYMAFVESGFRPQAVSRAEAFGLWQFIEGTGKAFGLKSFPADFHDVEKSTLAAADYLFQLDNLFGSRLLAVAAYNCGEGNVRKCLRAIDAPGKRSFWGIRGCLPDETKEYVPQVLAAAVIGADPKLFGFDLPDEDEMLLLHDVVIVPGVTSLAHLAELAEMSVASLRRDNSELAGRTNTPGRNFPLYVPKGRGPALRAALKLEERIPTIAPMGSIETAQP